LDHISRLSGVIDVLVYVSLLVICICQSVTKSTTTTTTTTTVLSKPHTGTTRGVGGHGSLLQPSRQTATPFTADDIASYFSSKIDAIRLTTATVPAPVITARPVQPLLDFDPVTDDEVVKLLKSVANKQCALDPVLTSLTSWSQSSLLWSIYH